MPDTAVIRARPADAAKQIFGMREAATKARMSLTQFLEDQDPTHEWDAQERSLGLDAYGRVLRELNLRTNSVPERGIQASLVQDFAKNEHSRAMFDEWMRRRMRESQGGPAARMRQALAQRAVYNSNDQAPGTTLNQIAFDPTIYAPQVAPAVPIAEIVAKTTPIVGGTYESFYLTDVTAQKRFVRVTELADIPGVKLTGSDHASKVRKFGRKLTTSYEALRRIPVDMLALHIARMMVQTEVDKLAAIIDIAVNGDQTGGNGATVYNLTTLDSGASVNNLTLKAYLRFKAKFANPYTVTTILAQEDVVVATQLLSTGNANIPLAVLQANQGGNSFGFGNFVPINNEFGDSVRLGITSDAPASKLLAFDRRFAIEQIVEQGAEITESDRWITNQSEAIVMTYSEAYAIIDANAIKILDLSA